MRTDEMWQTVSLESRMEQNMALFTYNGESARECEL